MGKIADRRSYLVGIQLRGNLFCLTCMAKERLASLPQVKLVQTPLVPQRMAGSQLLPGLSQETLSPMGRGGHPAS